MFLLQNIKNVHKYQKVINYHEQYTPTLIVYSIKQLTIIYDYFVIK